MQSREAQKLTKQFPSLNKAVKKLKGAKLYLVGGAVRDMMLNRPTTDVDVIVTGAELDELEAALKKFGDVNLVGKTFGVLKFQPKDDPDTVLDVALPRTEHSWGLHGGYKEFDVQSDPTLPIEKDLERRDFTINAMAVDLGDGRIIDPFNGEADLQLKVVRAVGDPRERFLEDHTRILRALRFACELDFTIEKETWKALRDRMIGLSDPVIPKEIIGKEIVKAYRGDPVRAFDLFEESGVTGQFMPELHDMKGCEQPEEFHTEGDVWVHTRLALTKLSDPAFQEWFPDNKKTVNLALAILFHDIGKPFTKQTPEEHGTDRVRFNNHDVVGEKLSTIILNRIKASSSGLVDVEHIAWLVRNHLVVTRANVNEMKPTTIEKYFLNERHDGTDLMKLFFCDTSASPDQNGRIHYDHLRGVMRRVAEIKRVGFTKASKPKLLITGDDIMKELELKPGPKIGELLDHIREAQLSGTVTTKNEALKYLKTING